MCSTCQGNPEVSSFRPQVMGKELPRWAQLPPTSMSCHLLPAEMGFAIAFVIISLGKMTIRRKKYRIRETMNLSTDADHRTNIFFGRGVVKKEKRKKERKKVTRDM